jgi:hypothetical protein
MSDAIPGAAPAQAAPAADANQTTNTQNPTGTATAQAQTGADSVKSAAQEVMRKYKVKVSGEEREVDEKELLRGYSHQSAANKEMQEAKRLRKQNEDFVSMMRDPEKLEAALEKLGHKPRELYEARLAKQLKVELMSPEQKAQYERDLKLEAAEAKLREIDEFKAKEQEAVKQKHFNEMKAKFSAEYNDQFVETLKSSGLPPTKETVAKMASYISRAAKIGFEMTPQEAASMVKDDIQKLHLSVLGQSDGETLLKLLGDEAAQKILAARGLKVRNPEADLSTPQNQNRHDRQRNRQTSARPSHRDWRRQNGM